MKLDMGIDDSIGAFLINRDLKLGYTKWLVSRKNFHKKEIRKIMSGITKQNELNTLISEKGILLKDDTKEFLTKYNFGQGTKIRSFADEIIIHTENGAWSDEVCIKKNGSYTYCGGLYCVW